MPISKKKHVRPTSGGFKPFEKPELTETFMLTTLGVLLHALIYNERQSDQDATRLGRVWDREARRRL